MHIDSSKQCLTERNSSKTELLSDFVSFILSKNPDGQILLLSSFVLIRKQNVQVDSVIFQSLTSLSEFRL